MKVGKPEIVEVLIAVNEFTEEAVQSYVREHFRGRGDIQSIDNLQFIPQSVRVSIESTPDFEVKMLSPSEWQPIGTESPGLWRWEVTPLRSGQKSIVLQATYATSESDSKDEPIFSQVVQVQVNPVFSIRKYWEEHEDTLLSIFMPIFFASGGGLGFIAWLRNRHHHQPPGAATGSH